MNITKYIYDYLMEFNTPVVVPELGCFSIVNKPSEIRDGMVIPPVKTVALDSENTEDDHVFTLYIAKNENIAIEQVVEEIRKFYNFYFINRLSTKKDVNFEDFGTFSFDDETRSIVFEPVSDFFKENYGLDYAYFQNNLPNQSAIPPVTPESKPKPEPVIPVVTEPVSAPPPAPVQPEPVVPPVEEKKGSQSPSEETLFDTNNSNRFRENTERRRQEPKKQEPPVRPTTPKAKTVTTYKKQQKQTKNNSSNLWVLWVLLVAAGLGVGGYFLYPMLSSMFVSQRTTISAIEDADLETSPVPADSTETDTPNIELAQTLDDATDKRNALNPESSRQTPPSTQQAAPQSVSSASKPEETIAPSQGSGRYVLIVGSFTTYSAADRHGKKMLAKGINYEIIDAGDRRFRISVAGFDDKNEAIRQASQMKSKPYCENVWVARR